MKKESKDNDTYDLREATNFSQPLLVKSIDDTSKDLEKLSAQDQLQWAYEQFNERFVLTSSVGILSAVLLHMTVKLKSRKKPIVIYFLLYITAQRTKARIIGNIIITNNHSFLYTCNHHKLYLVFQDYQIHYIYLLSSHIFASSYL